MSLNPELLPISSDDVECFGLMQLTIGSALLAHRGFGLIFNELCAATEMDDILENVGVYVQLIPTTKRFRRAVLGDSCAARLEESPQRPSESYLLI